MNKHLILIKYVGPTDSRGSRIKLVSQRFPNDSVTFGYDDELNGAFDNGMAVLAKLDYTVYCSGEMPACYWACVNEFKSLKVSIANLSLARKLQKTA